MTALACARAAADGQPVALLAADFFELHEGRTAGRAGMQNADFHPLPRQRPEQLHHGTGFGPLAPQRHQHGLEIGGQNVQADVRLGHAVTHDAWEMLFIDDQFADAGKPGGGRFQFVFGQACGHEATIGKTPSLTP